MQKIYNSTMSKTHAPPCKADVSKGPCEYDVANIAEATAHIMCVPANDITLWAKNGEIGHIQAIGNYICMVIGIFADSFEC